MHEQWSSFGVGCSQREPRLNGKYQILVPFRAEPGRVERRRGSVTPRDSLLGDSIQVDDGTSDPSHEEYVFAGQATLSRVALNSLR